MTRDPARTIPTRRLAIAAAALVLLIAGRASAASPQDQPAAPDPDWPCQQIRIDHMSLATVWGGPPVEKFVDDWQHYPAAAALAQRLAERRVSVAQAQAEITAFAMAAGDQRKTELLAFMGGLFALLDQERFAVVQGLDRFGARQQSYAAQIRAEIAALHQAQDAPQPDQSQVQKLSGQVEWDTRVFTDRNSMIGSACFVPDAIEHRLYELAGTTSSLLP